MEQAVNSLTNELLSQPIFLILCCIGLVGFVFSIFRNVNKKIGYFGSIIALFIFSLYFNIKALVFITGILILGSIVLFIMIYIREKNKKNEIKENITYNAEKDNICPKCGGILKERTGKYGKFYGCSNYPNCKYTQKI